MTTGRINQVAIARTRGEVGAAGRPPSAPKHAREPDATLSPAGLWSPGPGKLPFARTPTSKTISVPKYRGRGHDSVSLDLLE